jgi:hypothetical protein
MWTVNEGKMKMTVEEDRRDGSKQKRRGNFNSSTWSGLGILNNPGAITRELRELACCRPRARSGSWRAAQ